jgi:hypothetical protein
MPFCSRGAFSFLTDGELQRIQLELKFWRAEDKDEDVEHIVLANIDGEDDIAKKFAQTELGDGGRQFFKCLVCATANLANQLSLSYLPLCRLLPL